MSIPLTLVIEGEGGGDFGNGIDGVTLRPCGADDAEAVWTSAVNGADGWVGRIRTAAVDPAFFTAVQSQLASAPGDGVVVPLRPAAGRPPLWSDLPAEIACLVPEPLDSAALFVRSTADGAPASRPDASLWSSVVEAVTAGSWSVAPLDAAPRACEIADNLPPLVPNSTRVEPWWWEAVDALENRLAAAQTPSLRRIALLAGLWLLQDDLDRSHSLSQQIEGGEGHHGDYWHAIMHRREPDYINSKYWFRRVGRHPAQTHLASALAGGAFDPVPSRWREKLGRGGWDSLAFVDLCEAAESAPELDLFARRVQWCEMLALLGCTVR